MTDTKMKTLGKLAKELRNRQDALVAGFPMGIRRDICAKLNQTADRLERIEKAWRAYEALPFIDQGPMRFGCWPALDRVAAAIEGEP